MKNVFYVGRSLLVVALSLWTMSAMASPGNVYNQPGGNQDLILPSGWVAEIGEQNVFPVGEQLSSSVSGTTTYSPCSSNYDNPDIPNVVVTITNLTGRDWANVWYVADQGTTLTNYDGYVGNVALNDAQQAFKIDAIGTNMPLIFESLISDGIWENNETWTFVIEDFVGANGGPAAPFDDIGIASLSSGWPKATGSILVPEPSTLALLLTAGFGLLAYAWRKRR